MNHPASPKTGTSHKGYRAAYLRMLQQAHVFSASIPGEEMEALNTQLEKCNAFKAPDEASLKI